MSQIEYCRLLGGGYCTSKKHHALRGAEKQTIKFYATFGLIKHTSKGYILFDTGYGKHFFTATRKFPYSIYKKITPVYLTPEKEIVAQLNNLGIEASEINYIIVSHFHADHVGALKEFENATFVCSQTGYDAIKNAKGFKALKQGFLPYLMPNNFEKRTKFIDFKSTNNIHEDLGPIVDLFGDNSILLSDLDGHATGQIGALIQTPKNKVFYIADAAWLKQNYTEVHLPSPIVKLFFGSWKNFVKNLQKINRYHKKNMETIIIPTHCEETLNLLKEKEL